MKTRSIALTAFVALSTATHADITAYSANAYQFMGAQYYDPSSGFLSYPLYGSSTPAYINQVENSSVSFLGNNYSIVSSAAASLNLLTLTDLDVTGYMQSTTSCDAAGQTLSLAEVFDDQYLNFTLSTPGSVSLKLNASSVLTGSSNMYCAMDLDGVTQLSYLNGSSTLLIPVAAGNHTVRIEFQNEALAGTNFGYTASSLTTLNTDYEVRIHSQATPEPMTLAVVGVGALGLLRRKRSR